ncbi:MAG: hypothetical protein EXQ87_13760 [Alphaproteobacteria bacterium]|nr:hypothetical protein [Alphaproteobacteria bacterium]
MDFNRALDPEIPQKTWRSYHRGDTGVFTRRLLGLRDSVPNEKIRQKYESDSEFRSHSQRYFQQFEELVEQAAKNDHGDLLGSTLMTSEVGRLYMLLAGAVGRDRLVRPEAPPTPGD